VEGYTNQPYQHYIGSISEAKFNKETERKLRSVALAAKSLLNHFSFSGHADLPGRVINLKQKMKIA
jgi:hypothetical protein